jgi:ribosomal protein L44E
MIGSALNQVTNALSQVSLQSNGSTSQATPTSEVLNVQKTSKNGRQKGKS